MPIEVAMSNSSYTFLSHEMDIDLKDSHDSEVPLSLLTAVSSSDDSSSDADSTLGEHVVFPTKPTTPIACHLQQLAWFFVNLLCNKRDFSHPFIEKHVALEFRNRHDFDDEGAVKCHRDTHLLAWQQVVSQMPNFWMDVVDILPDIDKSGFKARTWCWKREGGVAGGFKRESVSIQYWELREKEWVCVEMRSLLGVGF